MMKLIKSQKGELSIDVLTGFIIGVVSLLTLISFISVIMQWQQLNYISKTITESIEIEGQVSSDIYSEFNRLKSQIGIDCNMAVSTVYYSGSKIQYRTPFEVKVTANVDFVICKPAWAASKMVISIPMNATYSGKSQVYWKS